MTIELSEDGYSDLQRQLTQLSDENITLQDQLNSANIELEELRAENERLQGLVESAAQGTSEAKAAQTPLSIEAQHRAKFRQPAA